MYRRMAVLFAVVACAAGTARAQDSRVEIGAVAGWTLSDGVTTDTAVQGGDGVFYNSIDPDDSFSYSINLGFFVNETFEIGGLFSQQKSKMLIGGAPRASWATGASTTTTATSPTTRVTPPANRGSTSSAGRGSPATVA